MTAEIESSLSVGVEKCWVSHTADLVLWKPLIWCVTATIFPRKLKWLNQLTRNSQQGCAGGLEVSHQTLESREQSSETLVVGFHYHLVGSKGAASLPLLTPEKVKVTGKETAKKEVNLESYLRSVYLTWLLVLLDHLRKSIWLFYWLDERTWEACDSPPVIPVIWMWSGCDLQPAAGQ